MRQVLFLPPCWYLWQKLSLFFETIEAQIQCPPLLYEQLKEVTLEAWDQVTPQGEPKGSYTKILQGPNEAYTDFLARLETVISHSVTGEETKIQLEKRACIWKCKSKTSKGYHSNTWDQDCYWLFGGLP